MEYKTLNGHRKTNTSQQRNQRISGEGNFYLDQSGRYEKTTIQRGLMGRKLKFGKWVRRYPIQPGDKRLSAESPSDGRLKFSYKHLFSQTCFLVGKLN